MVRQCLLCANDLTREAASTGMLRMNVLDLIGAEALQEFLRGEHAVAPAVNEHQVGRVADTH